MLYIYIREQFHNKIRMRKEYLLITMSSKHAVTPKFSLLTNVSVNGTSKSILPWAGFLTKIHNNIFYLLLTTKIIYTTT